MFWNFIDYSDDSSALSHASINTLLSIIVFSQSFPPHSPARDCASTTSRQWRKTTLFWFRLEIWPVVLWSPAVSRPSTSENLQSFLKQLFISRFTMAGTIARKAIDHLKSKEFREYLMRCVLYLVLNVFLACMLNKLAPRWANLRWSSICRVSFFLLSQYVFKFA